VKLAFPFLTAVLLLAAAGCGYDTSTTFNADGTVTIGLKLLFPKDLVQGANGPSVSGFTPTDLASANSSLHAKYPGATIVPVTEATNRARRSRSPSRRKKPRSSS
jgi:hypothetical protein